MNPKIVNAAFDELRKEVEHLRKELSAMQTFLAAHIAAHPTRAIVVTKDQINVLHIENLAEIDVQPQPNGDFHLTVQVPKGEQGLIIASTQ